MYPWTGTSGVSEADSWARFPPPFRVSVVVALAQKDDRLWHIASFRCAAGFGRYWGIADAGGFYSF